MYGKWFASAYTGSMLGAGAHVFAVWAWCVANAGRDGVLEINPRLLAAMIGEPDERIVDALDYLQAPDPNSRSEECEGRRLVHEGAYQYRIVNHARYRQMRAEEDRREQNRRAKRRQRAKQRQHQPADIADSQQSQPNQRSEIRDQKQRSDLCDREVSPTDMGKVRQVFEAWKLDTGHHRAKLSPKRVSRIRSRLREGFTPEELIAAITHRHHDPWLMGANDTGRVYDQLATLLRDAEQVERLRDLTQPLRPAKARSTRERQLDKIRAWGERSDGPERMGAHQRQAVGMLPAGTPD